MKTKRKISVTLSDDDIKEAVVMWLNQTPPFDHCWSIGDITISTEQEWVGNGMTEHRAFKAVVKAEK